MRPIVERLEAMMGTEQRPPDTLSDREVFTDLKAAVHTQRELGTDMEDYVLEAFLARIEKRVDERVAQKSGSKKVNKSKRSAVSQNPMRVTAGSLLLSIPLVAISGDVAQAKLIIVVMLTVLVINVLYFIDRWVQMSYTGGATD
jgi:hypothetical protein